MPIKPQSGNMYEFVTHTWNPVRGKCAYNCSYCYVKKWGEPGLIHLDERELRADLDEGNYIFVCSGCDLFHKDMSKQWIDRVMDWTAYFPDNQYLWHTKNPNRALDFQGRFHDRDMLCVTIESNRDYPDISAAPPPYQRFANLYLWEKPYMLTIEPVLDFDIFYFTKLIVHTGKNLPVQINIGADSGNNHLPEPSREDVLDLITELEKFTTVYKKPNLDRILKGKNHG